MPTRLIISLLLTGSIVVGRFSHAAEISGTLQQWHAVSLDFDGPQTAEDATPNPFTSYRLDVLLIHPQTSQRHVVPGYFAADGNAAETSATAGSCWRIKFSPPLIGRWTYQATLTRNGQAIDLEGDSGEFVVSASEAKSSDFRKQGQLQYVGERYLRFAGSGEYFLKAGVNSPETMLGYHDIDGTWHDKTVHPIPAPQNAVELPSLDKGLHHFEPHLTDWQSGDPTWQNDKGKGLIGGINYLSNVGVNSMYFLTMNVNGDGRNVWPWTEPWQHERFDISKLDQWDIIFSHMQSRGIVMHVVLQETENDHILDNGRLGVKRKLYLREMVARYSHHPGLIWNLGEENLQTVDQQEQMSSYIRSIDPYDHPIVIHNDHHTAEDLQNTFDPHLGKSTLDGLSVQDLTWNDVHANTKRYVDQSRRSAKPWFVCGDEMGGANFGLLIDAEEEDHFNGRSKGLWANLMAGGAGVEWYFGWQNNSPNSDLSTEDWRLREKMYQQSKYAIDFFHRYLPFTQMQAADHLGLAYADYGFAKPGEVYCLYLFTGGDTRLDLQSHEGPFSVQWFDPRNGGELQSGPVQTVWGGGLVQLGDPPSEKYRDWVCLVRKTEPTFTSADGGKTIVVEAERFESQRSTERRKWVSMHKSGSMPGLEGEGKATTWVRGILAAAKNASGGSFLRLLPDTRKTHDDKLIRGVNFSPEPGKMAILSYRVQFDQPGRYHVWVRAFSRGTEDNGLHVGLNGDWPESGRRMQWCEGKKRWTWASAQRTEEEHCGVPMQIFIDVPSAGVHTVEFSMREDGFAFDQFLLTTDSGYRPGGPINRQRVVTPKDDSENDRGKTSNDVENRTGTVSESMQFPRSQWRYESPESQGVRGESLDRAMHYIAGHCKEDQLGELFIVRNGVCIHNGHATDTVHNIWSCSKSFTSTALGLLINDGACQLDTKIASVDENLQRHYPDVTLRHMTTMTSGYSAEGRSRWEDENEDWSWTPYQPEAPLFDAGQGYAYWDENMMMLGRLLTRVGQTELNRYLRERIFDPIGMGDVTWSHEGEIDRIKICNGCTNIELNAKQLARYGHLMLNRGQWKDQSLIPSSWVDAATKTQVPASIPVADTDRSNVRGPGAYGFNWWTNGGEYRMPDAPPKTYYASGLNHNLLFVIPEWNMVIVRMGVDGNPSMGKPQAWNGFFRHLATGIR